MALVSAGPGVGMGYPLAHGRVAAEAIERAVGTDDFSLRDCRRRVLLIR
jgi:hypothetical protein